MGTPIERREKFVSPFHHPDPARWRSTLAPAAIAGAAALLLATPARGQCDVDNPAAVQASDLGDIDTFGAAVAICGSAAIIGSPNDDDGGPNAGAAYVYRRVDGGGWGLEMKLIASDADSDNRLGQALDLQGDVALVGAYRDDEAGNNAGAAYLFEFDGEAWNETVKFMASDAGVQDWFGRSVALDGDLVVIGMPFDDDLGSDSGAAYIFRRDADGVWFEEAKLRASDGAPNRWFGERVAAHGNTVVVGAPTNGNGGGAAYVFEFTEDAGWIEVVRLELDEPMNGDDFGLGLDMNAERLVVGAPGRDVDAANDGVAAVFMRSDWTLDAVITAGLGPAARLGESASINDAGVVLLGAPGADAQRGAAIAAQPVGAGWLVEATLTWIDTQPGDELGNAVALSDEGVSTVGVWRHDGMGMNAGAGVFYTGLADCDGNGELDACDIGSGELPDANGDGIPDVCQAGSPDLDGDGVVGPNDLAMLLAAWGPVQGAAPADLNLDEVVNMGDLMILLEAWSPPASRSGATFGRGGAREGRTGGVRRGR